MKTFLLKLPVILALSSPTILPAAPAPDEFTELQRQIAVSAKWDRTRLHREAQREAALILDSDRTPMDVVWRRTKALLEDLRSMPSGPDLSAEAKALEALRQEMQSARAGGTSGATAVVAQSFQTAGSGDFPVPGTLRNSKVPQPADKNVRATNAVATQALFQKLTALRRQIAFKNPLLNFDAIVFLKHNKQVRGYRHMVDQYLGFNAEKAGGVFVLRKPFSNQPVVESLLATSPVQSGRLWGRILDNQGGFLSLDLDFDGRSILFAFTEAEYAVPKNASYENQYCSKEEVKKDKGALHHYFRPESTYHIFRANADGTDLRQLTDGMWNDTDACFLPNGRIAFISERAGGQVRCGMRPLPSATLHAMMGDGSDIIQLSWHDTQEWHPSVDNQGMIAYTRWDYVDRDSDVAQHLWTCYPDGRDPRSPHGNYPDKRELRPWMEMSIRAVPGSHKYVAVATPHHGEAYGSIVLIDPRQTDDRATAQLRRVTPEVPFPESESAPGVPHDKGKHSPAAEVYGTPWPLSEDYFLCVYDAGQRNYGIYLLDAFGNRELLYRDENIACLDPIPLRARPRPPVIPVATVQAKADQKPDTDPATGVVAIINVYDSAQAWPAGTKIKEVRVVNIFPKDNPFQDMPNMGVALQSLGRGVLGVAPVEADGSAHFKVPAGAPIYFQLLDENGLAVQTMRSDTYVHPGETLTCAGCHESKQTRPGPQPQNPPLALQRPPSSLRPEADGSNPLTFPRLVQPVLNAKCVICHDKEPKAPSLHGDRFVKHGWSEAFQTLSKYAWGRSGGNGIAFKERQFSVPGQDGARVSRLYQQLAKGHHHVELSANELRRLTTWLDCNSNFYAAYSDAERQAHGEVVKPKWGQPKWLVEGKISR